VWVSGSLRLANFEFASALPMSMQVVVGVRSCEKDEGSHRKVEVCNSRALRVGLKVLDADCVQMIEGGGVYERFYDRLVCQVVGAAEIVKNTGLILLVGKRFGSELQGLIEAVIAEVVKQVRLRELKLSFVEVHNEISTDLLRPSIPEDRILRGETAQVLVDDCFQLPEFLHEITSDRRPRSHVIVNVSWNNAPGVDIVDVCSNIAGGNALETRSIKTTLLTLEKILANVHTPQFLPFRDCKLTRLLQPTFNDLGESGFVIFIDETSSQEDLGTLRFVEACRAKKTPSLKNSFDANSENCPFTSYKNSGRNIQSLMEENKEQDELLQESVNEISAQKEVIKMLQDDLAKEARRAEKLLDEKFSTEKTNEELRKELASLQEEVSQQQQNPSNVTVLFLACAAIQHLKKENCFLKMDKQYNVCAEEKLAQKQAEIEELNCQIAELTQLAVSKEDSADSLLKDYIAEIEKCETLRENLHWAELRLTEQSQSNARLQRKLDKALQALHQKTLVIARLADDRSFFVNECTRIKTEAFNVLSTCIVKGQTAGAKTYQPDNCEGETGKDEDGFNVPVLEC